LGLRHKELEEEIQAVRINQMMLAIREPARQERYSLQYVLETADIEVIYLL
jgi:hypothetical protein